MRVPETSGARTGCQSRRTPESVARKADKSEYSPRYIIRQQRFVASRFNISPHVAALVANLAFNTEART